MKNGKAYTLNFRRKREGKTDYKSRLKLLTSRKPRVVLRRMLNNFSVQIIKFESAGDKVLVSAHTRDLLKFGWKAHRGNLSAAYLVGFLCGLRAKKKNITSGVADLGLFRVVPGSGFFAALKGIKDAGFDIAVGEKSLPSEERISGKHIEAYAVLLKNKEEYSKIFSQYIKAGLKPEELSKHFEEVKKQILKDGAN